MAKKSVAKNYIYNVLYEILAILIPFITTPYLSRVLGAERIGIYSYTLSIVTYFILFGSLGVSMYGKREIAFIQKDRDSRSKVFFEILILRFITLSFSMILFYSIFCTHGDYKVYYTILLLEIVANMVDISWYFQGLEEFKKTVIRNTLIKIISTVCIFCFVKTQSDLWKYFIIYVSSTFLGNISLWLYLPKFVIKQKITNLDIKKHIKPTIMLFIPQIATQIYTVLDKTMIGTIIIDKSEVGFYEQAQKMIKLLLTLATSLGIVMMPRIAATFAEGNKEKIKEYMKTSFSFILMLTFPLMFGISSIASRFVPVFYGNGFEKVSILICVISPILVLIGLSNVTGTQYLLPTKQQNKYTISVVVGALVNFILNLIFIKKFASVGASIATVIAELSVATVQFILVKDQIKFSEVFKLSYKYFLASIIMFICSIIVGRLFYNDIIAIVVQIVVSLCVYFAMLLILRDSFIFESINTIKKKIMRKTTS